MKKILIAFLEYGFIIGMMILIAAFVGLPPGEEFSLQKIPAPSIPRFVQGVEPWDKDLTLPTRSDRIANYTMDVRLDTKTNIIHGWEILEWKNTTGRAQQEFPFHLYHNAWKNNRSTFFKEEGGRQP